MSDVIDLDALIPRSARVKFGDQEITVNPPRVATILRIADFWQTTRLAAAIPEKDLEKALDDLKTEIYKCVPELEGQDLSYPQITTLVEMLTKMSLPPETKELKERNITIGGDEEGDPKDQ